jgi:hypothetical protein
LQLTFRPIAWTRRLLWTVPASLESSRRHRVLTSGPALAIAYVFAHVAPDWVSYVQPVLKLGIAPWNPQAGLSLCFLLLLGSGPAHREIAERLAISPRTVEVYKARIMAKLHCRSLAEIVRFSALAKELPCVTGDGV